MGEAKRRRTAPSDVIYHHTSTLRTNLIWMSGVIDLEGRSEGALHPKLGLIETDAKIRRPMKDFPALAWFTTQTRVPSVLTNAQINLIDTKTGRLRQRVDGQDLANALALQRVAIGFRMSEIGAVPWPEHYGYATAEGIELNETAIELGDDPRHWYVTDAPVDLLLATEFWSARSIMKPVLKPFPAYLPDLHRMVKLCRANPGTFIPPSWLTPDQAQAVAASFGKPILSGSSKDEA